MLDIYIAVLFKKCMADLFPVKIIFSNMETSIGHLHNEQLGFYNFPKLPMQGHRIFLNHITIGFQENIE